MDRLKRIATARRESSVEVFAPPFGCDPASYERLLAEATESARRREVPLIFAPERAPTVEAWIASVHRDGHERGLE